MKIFLTFRDRVERTRGDSFLYSLHIPSGNRTRPHAARERAGKVHPKEARQPCPRTFPRIATVALARWRRRRRTSASWRRSREPWKGRPRTCRIRYTHTKRPRARTGMVHASAPLGMKRQESAARSSQTETGFP